MHTSNGYEGRQLGEVIHATCEDLVMDVEPVTILENLWINTMMSFRHARIDLLDANYQACNPSRVFPLHQSVMQHDQ